MSVVAITAHPRFKQEREPTVSKARMSEMIGFSTRWLELRDRDGLPSRVAANGHRRYVPSEVERWVADYLQERANGC